MARPQQQDRRDRGAVMVMATFVALFLVALVYHVHGVGAAALEAQVVQDGADSVAFSAATAKARGMNILALINLVMAAVLAVLVALRVLQAILTVAIVAVGVACVVTQGAACGAMVPLGNALNRITDIADDVEPRIKDVLDGLEDAADAVNQVVPILAEAEAVYVSTRGEYDPVELGFAWPVVEELPTVPGSFEELCERAGENVVVACTFLLPGDLPEFAQETVGELVGSVAGSFSSFFCGGSDPPADAVTREVAYPLQEHPECDSAAARPAESSGQCGSSQCDQCSAWGCAACLGKQDAPGYARGLWTRTREEWVEWPDGDSGTAETGHVVHDSELVWRDDDPCDGEGSCGAEMICDDEEFETAGDGYPPEAIRVTRSAYSAFHSCLIEQTIEMEVEGEPLDPDEWAKPRALDEEQLPEGLRVRGFVLGGSGSEGRLGRVGIAGGGGDSLAPGGRLAFAAADFLSAEMDLWHMSWRARLIRFRWPSGEGGLADSCSGEFAAECQSVGAQVDESAGAEDGFGLPGLEGFVLH